MSKDTRPASTAHGTEEIGMVEIHLESYVCRDSRSSFGHSRHTLSADSEFTKIAETPPFYGIDTSLVLNLNVGCFILYVKLHYN